MVVVVDSREQLPYWTGSQCFKTALSVGDYTTTELHGHYHIERKSLIDWYGTITRGHARFNREIMRARKEGVRFSIFVEGSKKDFIAKNFYRGDRLKIGPDHLRKIVATMVKRYDLDIVWCKSRSHAKTKTFNRLRLEEKKHKVISSRPRSGSLKQREGKLLTKRSKTRR